MLPASDSFDSVRLHLLICHLPCRLGNYDRRVAIDFRLENGRINELSVSFRPILNQATHFRLLIQLSLHFGHRNGVVDGNLRDAHTELLQILVQRQHQLGSTVVQEVLQADKLEFEQRKNILAVEPG